MLGIVCSGHPLVSEAAADILRAGGNAFDATVAAAFASTVAEPLLTSLAGGGFLLARAASGEEVLFDFFASSPGLGAPGAGGSGSVDEADRHFYPVEVRFIDAPQEFNIGMASVAVPGALKGFLHVHRRLGRLPLSEVVQPAVHLARDGVRVNDFQASTFSLLRPILRESNVALDLYTIEGVPPSAGTLHKNADLARFLEDLPGDTDGFYAGELAKVIERDMRERGGLLTATDLGGYEVVERAPLSMDYRGCRVITNPRPSSGGSLVGLSLLLQSAVEVPRLRWGSPEHVRTTATVLERTERLRAEGSTGLDTLEATLLEGARDAVRLSTGGTTHLNVSDAEGNVASLSMSNGEGSAYFIPGTGIHMNNMMGEDDLHPDGFHTMEPGLRISSMMAPTMVLDGEDVVAALGSGGSKRIRTAVYQVVTGLVDFGLPPAEAANRPRMHLDEGQLHVEPGFPEDAVAELRRGWKTVIWSEKNMYFGGVHIVAPRDGTSGGDARRAGHGIAVE